MSAALDAARAARVDQAARRAASRVPLSGGLVIVRADALNWALVRERVSADGRPREETLGYYGRLAYAARAAVEQLVADEVTCCELGQLIAAVDRAGRIVAEACAQRGEP